MNKHDPKFSMESPTHAAWRWLSEQLERARGEPGGVSTVMATLSPELAEVLTEPSRNPSNRSVSEIYVKNYSQDILDGRWGFNGESIKITSDGLLNDGQHRCYAVLAAGKGIETMFVFGVPRESRTTLDQGKSRWAADYLTMEGHPDAYTLGAVAGFVCQFRKRRILDNAGTWRPTKSEVLLLANTDPAVAAAVAAVTRRNSMNLGGRGLLGFCFYAIAERAGPVDAKAFIDALKDGANLSQRDPILYARNRIATERKRLSLNDRAELIFRAWNAHRLGSSPLTLMVKGGPLPELER